MGEKLTESAWTQFTKKQKLDLDDGALVKALESFVKCDENKPEPRLKALEAVVDQIKKQVAAQSKRKKELGDKVFAEVKDKLYELLETAEKLQAEIERAIEKARQNDDEEEESPALLTTKMLPLLRELKKGEAVMPALIAVAGKETVVLLSRRPISPARGKLLKEQMTNPGGVKFLRGECKLENKALTFVLQAAAAGLAKRVKAALLEQTGLRLNIRVRGDDGDDEEGGEDEAEKGTSNTGTESAGTTAKQDGAAAALLATLKDLTARFLALRSQLDAAGAYNTPIGEDIKKRVEDIKGMLQAHQADGVAKLLDQLEQIAKAVQSKKQGATAAAGVGEVKTQARAAADALLVKVDAGLAGAREQLAALTAAAFRAPAEAQLESQASEREKAAKTAGDEARGVALQKVLDAIPALSKSLSDALACQVLDVRFANLKGQLTDSGAYKTPAAEGITKRVDDITAQLAKIEPDGLSKLLDQIDQIVKAIAARKTGATAAAAQGEANTKAREAREAKEAADTLLAQLSAALLAQRNRLPGLTDAGLKTPVEAQLLTLEADRDKAAATVGDEARSAAQQLVLDRVPAFASALDEALLTQGLKQSYETDRALFAAEVIKADAASKAAPVRFTAAVASNFEAALKADGDLSGKGAWADARTALPKLKDAAAALLKMDTEADAYEKRLAALAADIGTAKGVVDAGLPSGLLRLKTAWTDSAAELDKCVLDKTWPEALAALERRKTNAIDPLKDLGTYGAPVLASLARLEADHKRANKLMQDSPTHFKAALKPAEQKAVGEFDIALAAMNWVDAKNAVDALELVIRDVLATQLAWEGHEAERATGMDDINAVEAQSGRAGVALPTGMKATYDAVVVRWRAALTAIDWLAARTAMQDLKIEATALQLVLVQGKVYYDAMKDFSADLDEGIRVLNLGDSRLTALVDELNRVYGEIDTHVQALEWVDAEALVLPLRDATRALVDANDKLSGKLDFEVALNKITGLHMARATAVRPPVGLLADLPEAFKKAQAAADVVLKATDFGSVAATTAKVLADATKAVQDLLDGCARLDGERKAFEAEMKLITTLEAARAMAQSGAPSLATAISGFNAAEAAIKLSTGTGSWTAALGEARTLATKTTELLAARGVANGAANDDTWVALQRQLDGLAARVATALTASTVPFIVRLQEAVRVPAAAAKQGITGKDRVAAEVALGTLTTALVACEKGIADHAAHLLKVKAAADGEIKAARAALLGSGPLNTLRTKELDLTATEFKALADEGNIVAADKAVVAWLEEARAWLQAKDAFDTLGSSGAPDKAKLAALNAMPGGGVVLDALIANLPATTPQSVMKDALNTRYGIEVKQFKRKNSNVTNLSGLVAVNETLPDKSLQALYEMLGDVPIDHIKDKVKNLIRFTKDTGGAAYGNKNLYMYCGRSDDPGEQAFGQPGGVLPPGEKVESNCEPTNKDPIPYFRFAALHEVGHAEDDAGKHMEKPEISGMAGWLKHSSDEVAGIAAQHFGYDLGYLRAVLADKSGRPPATKPPSPGPSAIDWEAARVKAVDWCSKVRVDASLWYNPAGSKSCSINGRVYQEAYEGDWVSYTLAARSQGISSYQFRSPVEWFADLYAAYYCKKLKPDHPAMSWLTKL